MDYTNYLSDQINYLDQDKFNASREKVIAYNYDRLLPENKSARILELGPGLGNFLVYLSRQGYTNITAIDLSEEVARHCNSLIPGSTTVTSDPTGHLNRQTGIDRIFTFHVLEHVPKNDVIPLLAAAYKSLAPGGKLIIEVPNMECPFTGLSHRYRDFSHEMGYTDVSLRYPLHKAGFQNIGFFGVRTPITSLMRLVQVAGQKVLLGAASMALRFFEPNLRHIMTPAITAVATK